MLWPHRHLGSLTVALGVVHTALALTAASLPAMIAQGWWGAGAASPSQRAWVWFFAAGPALILQGLLVRTLQRHRAPVPRAAGVLLLLMMLAIATALPVSGAWLGALLALAYLTYPAMPPAPEQSATITTLKKA